MKRFFLLALPVLLLTACSHTYYVVRHAEKADQEPNMTSDVPLSQVGQQRALELKKVLTNKKIAYAFSTNTIRTTTTAKPTADRFGLQIQTYGPRPDSAFIAKLKALKKNTLIVGHSNTVDDIVNGLTGSRAVPGDLQDSDYNNLFVVRVLRKKVSFERKKYGK